MSVSRSASRIVTALRAPVQIAARRGLAASVRVAAKQSASQTPAKVLLAALDSEIKHEHQNTEEQAASGEKDVATELKEEGSWQVRGRNPQF